MASPGPKLLRLPPEVEALLHAEVAAGNYATTADALRAAARLLREECAWPREQREAQQRLVDILESINECFYALDAEWRFTYVNAQAEAYFGIPRHAMLGRAYMDVLPKVRGHEILRRQQEAMRAQTTSRFEILAPTKQRWIEMNLFPRGDRLTVFFRDITERKAMERHQAMLTREVDHRAKNLIAIVKGIVGLAQADNVPEFKLAVQQRLNALARVHSLLARDRWHGAGLQDLLESELRPFMGRDGGPSSTLRGPRILLPPAIAQALSMVFHELATNAAKYGALSLPAGHVTVLWTQEAEPSSRPRLWVQWTEAGGPALKGEPTRRGFGSAILEGVVQFQLGGDLSVTWDTAGLVCDIRVHLEPAPTAAQ